MYEVPERIKKQMRKARKHQFLVLFLLSLAIAAVGCGVKLFAILFEERVQPVRFDYVNENTDYSEVYIQQISYPFASYIGNTEHQIYFALDKDAYPYVVCMSDNQFKAFEPILEYTYSAEEMEAPAPVPLYGMPVPYDEELKEQVLEYCDFFLGEGFIEEANFRQWLGDFYLDATLKPVNLMSQAGSFIMIIGAICIAVTSILLVYWFRCRRVNYALMSTPGFEQITISADRQTDRSSTIYYKKAGLCLTDDFIISWKTGFDIIRFDQIRDVKQYPLSAGFFSASYIAVTTRDGRVHKLASASLMTALWCDIYTELICLIKDRITKEPDIMEDEAAEYQVLKTGTHMINKPKPLSNTEKSNLFLGTIGAFIYSLVGVVIWVLVGKAGFIAGMAGYLIMYCAMRGYRTFGKVLDKKGTVISILVTVIMIFAANWSGHCIDFYTLLKATGGSHVTLFTVLRDMPSLMTEYDMWSGFTFDLMIGYALSFWCCFVSLKQKLL